MLVDVSDLWVIAKQVLLIPFEAPASVLIILVLLFLLQKKQFKRYFGDRAGLLAYSKALASQALWGLAGGILGSWLLLGLGIDIDSLGVQWLWPLALILMLFHHRFLCFSYAAGILTLSNLLWGWPEVNGVQLMYLVAVLHLLEAVLIWFTGARYAAPITVAHPRQGTVGGFYLQAFWPIPLVIWVQSGADFYLLPLLAALGYSDLALTRLPWQRARRTAWQLAGFSLVLGGLTWLASFYPGLLPLAALFSPLGHELVVHASPREEMAGKPRWQSTAERGWQVLATQPGSFAEWLGLRQGDWLLNINGQPVGEDLLAVRGWVTVDFITAQGQWQRKIGFLAQHHQWGMTLSPRAEDQPEVRLSFEGLAKRLWQKLFRQKEDSRWI
ncbi:hypothetical protein SAMN02745885_01466 [Carboxydocella sporoproducens DSM 16521]|uniref:PDZ domain-containing protein n=2 Tax=Carboxydocella TaxID=178898 RepID=A0A1T4PZH3_9FIRM|nr:MULTISPECIES: hypothetical protein [Carboxydocella]AVX21250.1 hypothetical protein CFE_2085 [Carboxydocella thermautotrophica]AVX31682.1 hypothetical protein CTH_2118 [Carboxydocella thermautotrophica]SJZ96829.1 hypothetical protein SAMN02745885_01466 [Carboxydocella sporoproducens DSM 16521]